MLARNVLNVTAQVVFEILVGTGPNTMTAVNVVELVVWLILYSSICVDRDRMSEDVGRLTLSLAGPDPGCRLGGCWSNLLGFP